MFKIFLCSTLILSSVAIYPMQDEEDTPPTTVPHNATFSTKFIQILVDSQEHHLAPTETFGQIRDLVQSVEPLHIETPTPDAIFMILTAKLEADVQPEQQVLMEWEIGQKIRVMVCCLYEANKKNVGHTIASLQSIACMSDEDIAEAFSKIIRTQQPHGARQGPQWKASKSFHKD